VIVLAALSTWAVVGIFGFIFLFVPVLALAMARAAEASDRESEDMVEQREAILARKANRRKRWKFFREAA
jgi:multisubunit Na+/H+ antiporter MnhG subunit